MPRKSKLTDEVKWIIRRDYHDGAQPKALAITYGVSLTTISLILNPDSYERKKANEKVRYRRGREARA